MKNSLKRAASLIAMGVVAASACSFNAFAEGDQATADNGFSADQIAASELKPTLTASKKVITLAEATDDTPEEVNITVGGNVDQKYASTGMHIYYDSRLEIVTNRVGAPDIAVGEAGEFLDIRTFEVDGNASSYNKDMKGVFAATAAKANNGFTGNLLTLKFNPPKDAKEGDVYPIDIVYRSAGKTQDLFVNVEKDEAGKLMQAYAWTQGIYNKETNNNFKADAADVAKCAALADIAADMDGYIAIAGPVPTTTTTT